MQKLTDLKAKLETLETERKELIKDVRFSERDRETYTAKAKEIEEIKKEITAEELKEEIKSVNSFNARTWEAWQEIKEFAGDYFKADGSHTKKFSDFLQPIKEKHDLHIYAKYWSSGAEIKMSENKLGKSNSRSIYTENPPQENLKRLKFSEVMKARIQHNKYVVELEALTTKINDNFFIATGGHDLKANERKHSFNHI